ncbi:MAG: uncharacterized protein PWQ86_174 [Bacillota bacterium]|jgi:predicted nucleotidyltransferase|nr:uncharacterized protein [Bacillota bacterium]
MNQLVLSGVCQRLGVALVYLFGSQAENGLKLLQGEKVRITDPLADLDVGIVTEKPLPSGAERCRLYAELHNAFQDVFAPFPVDLTLLEENHAVFQAEAIKGICVFSSSQERRDQYEMNVLRRAADFRPFLEKFFEEALEGV